MSLLALTSTGCQSGKNELDVFRTVGSLALSVEDVAIRLFLYMDLLTKQARWQSELLMADIDKDAEIQSALKSLEELVSLVNRLAPVIETAPDIVTRETEEVLQTLQQERITLIANVDQQRIDTLVYLTRERTATIEALRSAQQDATEVLQSEREVILTSIETQRKALMADIEGTSNRIVQKSLRQSKKVVDHFFMRVLQLMALLFLLGMAIAVVSRFHSRGKTKDRPNRGG